MTQETQDDLINELFMLIDTEPTNVQYNKTIEIITNSTDSTEDKATAFCDLMALKHWSYKRPIKEIIETHIISYLDE